jgi:hypothetical protein
MARPSAAAVLPSPVPSPADAPSAAAASGAHLVLALEHPFKQGTLRVWVDQKMAVEEPLESRPTRKLLVFRGRKGRETEVLAVAPGPHVIRVRVQGEGFAATRTIRGTFKDGETRSLEVRVGGLIGKALDLRWVS